jgi:hypothetical protein
MEQPREQAGSLGGKGGQYGAILYPVGPLVKIHDIDEMSAQEEREWEHNHLSADEAIEWRNAGFAPLDAYSLKRASESPVFERFRGTNPDAPLIERQIAFAKAWLSEGIPADKAFGWSMCDFMPVEAGKWIRSGTASVDLARKYRDAGYRP